MFFSNWKKNKGIIYLSAFILLLSVYTITLSLMNEGGPVWLFAILMNHASPFFYLIPVLMYFYVRTTITDSIRLKKYDYLHFLPFAINLIGITPYLFKSFDYKYSVASKIIGNLNAFTHYDFDMLYPYEVNQIARPLQFLIYIIACLILIVRFLPKLKEASGIIKKQFYFMFYSFLFIIAFILLANLNYLRISIYYFQEKDINYTSHLINQNMTFISILYFVIPFFFLINPRLIYGLPQSKKQLASEEKSEKKLVNPEKNQDKKEIIENDENHYFSQLAERITNYFDTEKPYLNPDFSVHDLCVKLNVPRHHVQYCLNVVMSTKFADLKNEKRVNYTIELLKNGAVNNMSLEGISKLSGFASPSNFFTAFKKITGYTPIQWLENNQTFLNKSEVAEVKK